MLISVLARILLLNNVHTLGMRFDKTKGEQMKVMKLTAELSWGGSNNNERRVRSHD